MHLLNHVIPGIQGERGMAGSPGPQGMRGEPGPAGQYLAGEGIAIEDNTIKSTFPSHHIGEVYQGGLVFYVDTTGQHGLITSINDIAVQGIQWRNGNAGSKNTNAKADGIGSGETNTRIIIAQQTIDDQKGQFAALLATHFQVQEDGITPCKTPNIKENTCYGGWYLPSAYELQLLYSNLHQSSLSTFSPEFYWSSTEANVSNAWLINFSTGELSAQNKANTVGRVRAIKQF